MEEAQAAADETADASKLEWWEQKYDQAAEQAEQRPVSTMRPGLRDAKAATAAEHTAEIDARTDAGHREEHQMTGKQHGQQPVRHCTG